MSHRVSVETALQISEGDSSLAVTQNLELGVAQLSQNVRATGRIAIWDTFETWTDKEEQVDRTLDEPYQHYTHRTIHFSVLTIDPKETQQ